MTNRREFLRLISILSAFPSTLLQGAVRPGEALAAGAPHPGSSQRAAFPITVQLSPLPGQPAWKNLATSPDAKAILRTAIDQYVEHGFTGLEYPFHVGEELGKFVLEYARSRGMFLTYNHTFAKNGVEIFGRDAAPAISVYAAEYGGAFKARLAPVLAEAKRLPGVAYLFCYQDEPFHAVAGSFDRSDAAQREFRRRYGYDMPASVDAARNTPRQWLDLLNFQSDTFPDGWRQIYKVVKEALPGVKVILTHDSHSAMGAGVGSNEKIAVDDVFHWGADFADLIVFDIYPYMMFDFRYGEFGKVRKPRLSQFHFAFAQLRNLTYTYGKELGFWFGTYNAEWFKDFMGPELKQQSWAEAEICHTAVANGADFLISGYKVPEDKSHWDTLGENLATLHQAMPGLVNCRKAKAKACFIFPRTQYLQLQQEYWNVAVAYETFLRAFGELDCLHEEQVAKSGIGDYEIAVLFDVQLLPEAVARRIADFVSAGGVVIADCVPHLDAERKPLPVLEDLFGVESPQPNRVARSGVWVPKLEKPKWFVAPEAGRDEDVVAGEIIDGSAWGKRFYFRAVSPRVSKAVSAEIVLPGPNGAPALLHRKAGKGHTYLLGFCLQDTAFAAWKDEDAASRLAVEDLLWSIAQQAGVKPRIRSSNPDIEASLRASANEAYVFVINHEAGATSTRVSLEHPPFTVSAIRNVVDGKNLLFRHLDGEIVFDLAVERARPQVLRLQSGK